MEVRLLTFGMGTSVSRAESPRSSIMFLMSMDFSATARSAAEYQYRCSEPGARGGSPRGRGTGILPTVTETPSLEMRVIFVLSDMVKM